MKDLLLYMKDSPNTITNELAADLKNAIAAIENPKSILGVDEKQAAVILIKKGMEEELLKNT